MADTRDLTASTSAKFFTSGVVTSLVIAALVIVCFRGLQFPMYLPRDPGAFCNQAWMITNGRVPYRDFWEHKTPGMMLIFAGVFECFGPSVFAARIAEAVWVFVCALAMVFIERRLIGAAALGVSGPILAMFWSIPQMSDGGLYTGFWSGGFGILAVAAMVGAGRDDEPSAGVKRRWSMILAVLCGAAIFAAVACRQTGLGVAALVVPLAAPCGVRRAAGIAGVAAIAFAALACAALVALRASGGWDAYWHDTMTFNLRKNEWLAAADPGFVRAREMLMTLAPTLWLPASASVVALIVFAASHELRRAALFCGCWLAVGVAAAFASRAGYWHYALEAVPAMALLCGALAAVVYRAASRTWTESPRKVAMVVGPVVVALAMIGTVRWDEYSRSYLAYGWKYFRGETPRDQSENLLHLAAARLRGMTTPGEVVHVWSALPTIHFLSRTLPATRFPQNLPLLEAAVTSDEDLARVMADLRAARPRICVVVREGLKEFASRGDDLPPAQREWIAENYQPLGEPMTAGPAALCRYNHVTIQFYERRRER